LRIRFDPVDQGGAARRRRKETLEHDQPRTLFEDRLQRLDRLRIGKREQLAFLGEPIAQ
jgi:hypothetical protein